MIPKKLTPSLLKKIVTKAQNNHEGDVANYIPELANVDTDRTGIAVYPLGGEILKYSNMPLPPVTLQSTAKLIPLIGLLEDCGEEQLFEWVKVEPSGDDFSSISRLEKFGPKPSNPMLNAGAICLCSYIPGESEQQFGWLESWTEKLFNKHLRINPLVFASEKRKSDKNRALAHLLNSRNNLGSRVKDTLSLYFSLCSYEATLEEMLYLPALLANLGKDPKTGKRIISANTCQITLSIMATCGLYDETGSHMVHTGMPAKSGVSGYTVAVVPGKAGICVYSPRVNLKGNSIRGEMMLEALSKTLNWHFAAP